jgi:carbon-monoxide dehydrogenase medium subunit
MLFPNLKNFICVGRRFSRMEEFKYVKPENIDELCRLLSSLSDTGVKIVAGATDIIPQMHNGKLTPSVLISISHLSSLNFIRENDDRIEIGAILKFSELIDHPLTKLYAPSLVEAAKTIGSPLTRERATLGGNLGNASPAGDAIPPLLTLNASILLKSSRGEREIPLAEFLVGPGQTNCAPDEFIHHISFKKLSKDWHFSFLKLGRRKGMAISTSNAAAAICLGTDRAIIEARLALGAVAPTAVRCRETEKWLLDQIVDVIDWQKAGELIQKEIAPISDIRGSKTYRNTAAEVLAQRALEAVCLA